MNRVFFLITLSVAFFSCEPKPLCDDPNAINYQDMDDYCQYSAAVNFYLAPSTLELMLDETPSGANYFSIMANWKNNSNVDYYSGSITIGSSFNIEDSNIQIPTLCNYPYSNCIIIGDILSNAYGRVDEMYFTFLYQNSDPIVIWEGEVHLDPSDPCKIIEIIYE